MLDDDELGTFNTTLSIYNVYWSNHAVLIVLFGPRSIKYRWAEFWSQFSISTLYCFCEKKWDSERKSKHNFFFKVRIKHSFGYISVAGWVSYCSHHCIIFSTNIVFFFLLFIPLGVSSLVTLSLYLSTGYYVNTHFISAFIKLKCLHSDVWQVHSRHSYWEFFFLST